MGLYTLIPRHSNVHSLDLDAWINEAPSDSESEDEKPRTIFHDEEQRHSRHRQPEIDEEELARVGRLNGGTVPFMWRKGLKSLGHQGTVQSGE